MPFWYGVRAHLLVMRFLYGVRAHSTNYWAELKYFNLRELLIIFIFCNLTELVIIFDLFIRVLRMKKDDKYIKFWCKDVVLYDVSETNLKILSHVLT